MKRLSLLISIVLIFMLTGLLPINLAWAEKPSWDRHDKGYKHEPKGRSDWNRPEKGYQHESKGINQGHGRHRYFTEHQRTFIHDYYADYYRRGHCPPGLAKKHNGCMPPGQAKRWVIGRPLPRDVIYYDLEPRVLTHLGPPPAGHRFIRVAQDILLITIGTGMVVDAIDDLNWEFSH